MTFLLLATLFLPPQTAPQTAGQAKPLASQPQPTGSLAKQPAADPTLPPANAQVRLMVDGIGVQIYRCTPQTGGSFQWVFEAPEAKLLDRTTHLEVGSHAAGPTWTWSDGSSIQGTVLATKSSTDPASVPWLLLSTQAAGNIQGILTGITLVRRAETQAGTAPAYGCDAERANTTIRVPYGAVYTFYTTGTAK